MQKNQWEKVVDCILIACAILSTYCVIEIHRSLDRCEQTLAAVDYYPPEYVEDLEDD